MEIIENNIENEISRNSKISLFERMHLNNGLFKIVNNRKKFFLVSFLLSLFFVTIIIFKGFTLSIEFEGGSQVTFPANRNVTTEKVSEVFKDVSGIDPVSVQFIGTGDSKSIQIRSENLNDEQILNLKKTIMKEFNPKDHNNVASEKNISFSEVSSSWGDEISKNAFRALVVFVIAVSLYISLRFERDMAFSAVFALFFDLLATAGIYALVGLEVTPATIIGVLTILGYSLYDTVVVFDKVKENTVNILKNRKKTYEEAANLAVNETLVRSINTSIISLLPITSLLLISISAVGVNVLKDLALVLLVGISAGTLSSIFLATPMLVQLKSFQKKYKDHDQRVLNRRKIMVEG